MSVLMILYIIIVAIVDPDSTALMEGFSLILLVISTSLGCLFWSTYKKNQQEMLHQIYIYTPRIFPMLKMNKDNDMENINQEYIYFFSASLVFLVWSLLGGILLSTQSRYIGIGCSALIISIVELYVLDRRHKALNMKHVMI
jgi:hypothetical protein